MAEMAEMKSITNDSRIVMLSTILSAMEVRTGELRAKLNLNRSLMSDETYNIFHTICKKCEDPTKVAEIITTALDGFFDRLHQTIPSASDRFEWLDVSPYPNDDPMNPTQLPPNIIHPNTPTTPDRSHLDANFYTPESYAEMVRQQMESQ